MSDPGTAVGTNADKGKSSANNSIAQEDPPLDHHKEKPNKELHLKPNGNKKVPSVKSKTSRAREQNVLGSREKVPETAGHSCRTCRSADNSRMVQCDGCDGWHHYECVGVDDQIEKKPWRCVICKKVPKKRVSKVKVSEKKKFPKVQSVKSATSRKSSRIELELQLRKLEAERTLLEDKKKLIDRQYSVLQQLAEIEEGVDNDSDSVDGDSKVKDWLREQHKEDGTDSSDEYPGTEDAEESISSSSEEEAVDNSRANSQHFNPIQRSTPKIVPRTRQTKDTHSNRLNCGLTRNQLAARQVVARDLPIFTGNPEEWPIFLT
ncbi:uncharacterized protein LOC131687249 [Topomyia yanbarensis]|uniref:uncharacterized protein LOC131687249 n=1 Tax=Topomyia yanbarensis TaxID=2498891 RepID=UPI00273C7A83|nr:uncharacterized protein LOC131687249 [Topomyia yanbarensis]